MSKYDIDDIPSPTPDPNFELSNLILWRVLVSIFAISLVVVSGLLVYKLNTYKQSDMIDMCTSPPYIASDYQMRIDFSLGNNNIVTEDTNKKFVSNPVK